MSHHVRIERRGVAVPEQVAEFADRDRAITLALNLRRTVQQGERLYVQHPDGFTVV